MTLFKIKDFDPNYKENFNGYDIKGLDVYSNLNHEKIGTVDDLLVDQAGSLRYLIVDLGFWGYGKKVFLPIEQSQIDHEGSQVFAIGLTKEQAENLPEFSERLRTDNQYEDQVGNAYPPTEAPIIDTSHQPSVASNTQPQIGQFPSPYVSQTVPQQSGYSYQQSPQSSASGATLLSSTSTVNQPIEDSSAYYQQDPALYETNERDHAMLRRYEEHLRASYSSSHIY